MTSQQIADELARIAGWTRTADGWWRHPNGLDETQNCPVKIGSLDALEAFRRERLPGWEWGLHARDNGNKWKSWLTSVGDPADMFIGTGPDEWTARASALIAASKENKQ